MLDLPLAGASEPDDCNALKREINFYCSIFRWSLVGFCRLLGFLLAIPIGAAMKTFQEVKE